MVVSEKNRTADTTAREISATRVFDAPRELVWKAWTDPNIIVKWWGPNGFRTTMHEMNVVPGGTWEFVMHGPDGTDYKNKSIYREVAAPERLVYSHVSGPLFDATVTFAAQTKNKTAVTVRMLFESAALRDKVARDFGAVEGLQQTLGRLEKELTEMSSDEFVISRTFNAPRDLMWQLWTEEDRLAKWFGPKGASVIHSKNDLRPGGTYHYAMRTPDGKDIWGKWTYREIVRPERLVFITSFSDPNRGVTRHPMSPDWPREMLSTIEFSEKHGQTTVTVHWKPINATEAESTTFNAGMASMNQGWTGTFERLDQHLSQESGSGRTAEVTITRELNAPRSVVFKAWTDPKQLAQWWGPHHFTNPRCEFDARPGGAIHIDMRDPRGTVYPMKGIVHEVQPPERLVFTAIALDTDGKTMLESLTTVTLAENGGKTLLTVTARVTKSVPEAAPMLAGMNEGWKQTVDKLEQFVQKA